VTTRDPSAVDVELRAVVGPTAGGKSALAREVAARLASVGAAPEIVAVDAFTLYRGMDIGTAKPTPTERAEVPHHLVDVVEPDREVTVAEFQVAARAAIDDIAARGGLPVLVGGSGLYFRAVVDDLRFPPTDDATRVALEERWAGRAVDAWEHLRGLDPDAADRIDPANLRRTVRALEVIELTGERFSSYATAWDRYDSIYPGLRVAYLEPPTPVLRERIDHRARAMVDAGLVDEAAELRARVGRLSRTARQAIGYREAFAVIDDELDASELADAIAARTWGYARRQRSWFRRDPRCEPAPADQLRERLTAGG
jgi:tRNA dimethylallyltransferase